MLAGFALRKVAQQILLRVPESITFREQLTKEVASKLASGDCLEESLTVSVSPTGKGEWKTVCCEDDISLSVSFGCRYTVFISGAATSFSFLVPLHRFHFWCRYIVFISGAATSVSFIFAC